MRPAVFPQPPFDDHALLDSGDGEKLERFGDVVLARPDPQALWRRRLDASRWERADLRFVRESDRGGRWEARSGAPAAARGRDPEWTIRRGELALIVRPTPFKHVGVFPEQAGNWDWIVERGARLAARSDEAPRLLNLFGYTGAASIRAVQGGFAVTHVDASKASLSWMRENAAASGLGQEGLRVVLEDASVFVKRAVRRGERYQGVVLDPPHYGRGPKGERWQLETGLAPLVDACARLLAPDGFLVLSCYAVGLSPLALAALLDDVAGGRVEAGELALREEGEGGRLLPCGFCARLERDGAP